MSQKVMIDGVETEVFTKEEMEAQTKESTETGAKTAAEAATKAAEDAVEKYKTENPDQTEALEQAKKDLEVAAKKLEEAEGGGEGDTPQVTRLREERDKAETELKEGQAEMSKKIDTIMETMVGDVKKDLLTRFSQGDAELRKKIELEYDGFVGDAVTKEEITARMEKAVTLVTGAKSSPNILDGSTGAGARGEGNQSGEGTEHVPTENEKAIGKVLGISEEDRKKYGPGGEKAPKTTTSEK